jgi:hypothetical protein
VKRAIAMCVLAAGVARADGKRVDVELAKTIEIKVDYARGWLCDDASLVKADVVTRDDVNFWVVTGAKLGATTCRVGTDPSLPSYVFDVHVVPARKRK